jgi:lipoyl(octanoyl) transferase
VSASAIEVADLGVVPYGDALELQARLRELRLAGETGDLLLLLQHPPVYTRGRRSDPSELPLGEERYRERGIDVVAVRRGGRVTYHGPGQLVAYPVLATRDVPALVAALEAAMVAVAREHGVDAHGRSDEAIELTGAWTADGSKLGAVGLHVSRGVTTHGLALNLVTDLRPFGWIVPCGLTAPVSSLARERGAPDLADDPGLDHEPLVRAAGATLATALGATLERPLRSVPAAEAWRRAGLEPVRVPSAVPRWAAGDAPAT